NNSNEDVIFTIDPSDTSQPTVHRGVSYDASLTRHYIPLWLSSNTAGNLYELKADYQNRKWQLTNLRTRGKLANNNLTLIQPWPYLNVCLKSKGTHDPQPQVFLTDGLC